MPRKSKTLKPTFRVITCEDYDFIPQNVMIVNDADGWMFAQKARGQWFINSTNDNQDQKEDEKKFMRKILKAMKGNMELV